MVVAYQTYKDYEEKREVVAIEDEVWSLLTKYEKGMTFEQIYDNLYYRPFSATNQAVDSMVARKQIFHEKTEASDAGGNKYILRKFYRRFGD